MFYTLIKRWFLTQLEYVQGPIYITNTDKYHEVTFTYSWVCSNTKKVHQFLLFF